VKFSTTDHYSFTVLLFFGVGVSFKICIDPHNTFEHCAIFLLNEHLV